MTKIIHNIITVFTLKVACNKVKGIVEDTHHSTPQPDKHPIIEESAMMYAEIADKVATVVIYIVNI